MAAEAKPPPAPAKDKAKAPPPKKHTVKKTPIPDPIPVNGLIKLTRYAFLIMGIVYGAQRQRFLSVKEEEHRKEMAPIRAARAKQLAEEQKRANIKELEELFQSLLPK